MADMLTSPRFSAICRDHIALLVANTQSMDPYPRKNISCCKLVVKRGDLAVAAVGGGCASVSHLVTRSWKVLLCLGSPLSSGCLEDEEGLTTAGCRPVGTHGRQQRRDTNHC